MSRAAKCQIVLVDGSAAGDGAFTSAKKFVGKVSASPSFEAATLTERRLTVVSLRLSLGEPQHRVQPHHQQ